MINAWSWSLNAWHPKRLSRDKCWSLLIPDIKSHLNRDGWQLCSLKMLFYYDTIIITNGILAGFMEATIIILMKPQLYWLPLTLPEGALQRGVGDGGWGHREGSYQMAWQTQRKEPRKEGFSSMQGVLSQAVDSRILSPASRSSAYCSRALSTNSTTTKKSLFLLPEKTSVFKARQDLGCHFKTLLVGRVWISLYKLRIRRIYSLFYISTLRNPIHRGWQELRLRPSRVSPLLFCG